MAVSPTSHNDQTEVSPPLDFLQNFATLRPIMSEYGKYITRQKPTPILSSDPVQEKKAARRKLLDEVFQRRAKIYQRFFEKKHRLQANNDLATIGN
jgi:hypothetical protein